MKNLVAILILAFGMLANANSDGAGDYVKFQYDARCIFEAVADFKKVKLGNSIPLPRIRLASETPHEEFLAAAKEQLGGEKPEIMLHMYVAKTNEIYLNDASSMFRPGRTIDDVLAHEFVHFLQVRYQGETDGTADWIEQEAVFIQLRFRAEFVQKGLSPCR